MYAGIPSMAATLPPPAPGMADAFSTATGSPLSSTPAQARDRIRAPGSRASHAGGTSPPTKHRR